MFDDDEVVLGYDGVVEEGVRLLLVISVIFVVKFCWMCLLYFLLMWWRVLRRMIIRMMFM